MYPEPTVGAVIFNNENKILLCKSHKWNDEWVIPGGHVELGEKLENALKREIREETGLEIYDAHLISIKESVYSEKFHEQKHFIFIDYICKTVSSDVKLNDEAEEFIWVGLDEIDDLLLGGFTRELLERIRDKDHEKVGIFYNY